MPGSAPKDFPKICVPDSMPNEMPGSSSVETPGSSSVETPGFSFVETPGSSSVETPDSATRSGAGDSPVSGKGGKGGEGSEGGEGDEIGEIRKSWESWEAIACGLPDLAQSRVATDAAWAAYCRYPSAATAAAVDSTHAVASVLFAAAIVRDATRVGFRDARVLHDLANEARVALDAREPGFRWVVHRLLVACLRILDDAVPVPYPPIPARSVRYEDLAVYDVRRGLSLDGRTRDLSHDHAAYVAYVQERALEFLGVLRADHPDHADELDAHWTRRVVPASAAYDAAGGPKVLVAGPRRSRSVFLCLAGAECVPSTLGMLAEALGAMTSAPRAWILDFATARLKWTIETCAACSRCSVNGAEECPELPKVPLPARVPGAAGPCGQSGVLAHARRVARAAAVSAARNASLARRLAKGSRAALDAREQAARAALDAREQAARAAAALRELAGDDVTDEEAEMLASSAHEAALAARAARESVRRARSNNPE